MQLVLGVEIVEGLHVVVNGTILAFVLWRWIQGWKGRIELMSNGSVWMLGQSDSLHWRPCAAELDARLVDRNQLVVLLKFFFIKFAFYDRISGFKSQLRISSPNDCVLRIMELASKSSIFPVLNKRRMHFWEIYYLEHAGGVWLGLSSPGI